jgi:mono/diheme cytochrome c family protein
MKARLLALPAIGCALGLIAACSTRRSEPFTGSVPAGNPQVERGRISFMWHCHKCHPGGESGLGTALNDKPLPEFLIKSQVRLGLGAMPSFPRDQISDGELDDLVRYLKALRGQKPRRFQ